MPITFSGWEGKITDPYQRFEIPPEDTTTNRVGTMTLDEQNLIKDYEIDFQKKQQLDKWFEDYPHFGSAPEEKAAQGTDEYFEIRKEKKAELKALKNKWNEKQEHSYGGATWNMKPQDTAYTIYQDYRLTPVGKMFD